MICINCGSNHTQKNGNHNGMQRYICMACKKNFYVGKHEENYFIHFNKRFKKNNRNILTRENYCIPTNKISIPQNKIFLAEEHYSNEWVENHYNDCMKNFDLNMKYFERLNYKKFNKTLQIFVKKNKFIEINNLEDVQCMGIYILVLDKYKQVYIGMSKDIRKRILSHWSKKKEFDRLIYGSVDNSILSIDSFGVLDTTRIFYKKINLSSNIHNEEEKYVKAFESKYLLNRVAGGINKEDDEMLRNLELIVTRRERTL